MADTIDIYADSGKTVYVLVRNSENQIWQTTTQSWVTYATADIATYIIAATEQGTASGVYVADFPLLPAGTYQVASYIQVGTSPAATDALIDANEFQWGGIGYQGTQEYTDAQLLVEFRAALVAITAGQSYSVNGRQYTRANLKDVRDTINWLERRIDAASNGGGLLLVRFNRP